MAKTSQVQKLLVDVLSGGSSIDTAERHGLKIKLAECSVDSLVELAVDGEIWTLVIIKSVKSR